MWFTKSSLFLAIFGLAMFLAYADETVPETPTIDNRFEILKYTGYCTDADISSINKYLKDSQTLIYSFEAAIKATATSNTASGVTGRDGVVARKLFSKWFGIQFEETNGKQTVKSEYEVVWNRIESNVLAVKAFLDLGTVEGPYLQGGDKVYLSCSTAGLDRFEVDDTIATWWGESQGAQEVEINGRKLTIGEVYGTPANASPYYWAELGYYVYLPSNRGSDACQGVMGETFQGIYEHSVVFEGYSFDFNGVAPLVLLCPTIETFDVRSLADVNGYDPVVDSDVTIDVAMAHGSGTMLHELFHLATIWTRDSTNTAQLNDETILIDDYAYGPFNCLSLAAGTLIVDGQQIDKSKAILNADSYQYFAFAWWYYQQKWVQEGPSLLSYAPATFYNGFIDPWYA